MKTKFTIKLICFCLLSSAFCVRTWGQGTVFTYQGRLYDGANPANGTYDIAFRPFNVLTGGSQLTVPNLRSVAVSNGLFTTTLDFGSGMFSGGPVFLQLEVATNGGVTYTTLAPRQQLTPAPCAIYAGGAGAAGITGTIPASALANAWLLSGNSNTVSGQFVGTTDNQPLDFRVNNVRALRLRLGNDASGSFSNAPNVIGGSSANSALTTIAGATIAGGGGNWTSDGSAHGNSVTANFGTVSGGEDNSAGDQWATVGGGNINAAGGNAATISGGEENSANGAWGTVGGGAMNHAGGQYATVPGGLQDSASAEESFAAGFRAKADDIGSFVWADSSNFDFHSTTANQFRVRAVGGTTFVTAIDGAGNVTAGVHVLSGDTAWSSISDKNAKKNFQPVNGRAVLEKLNAVPVEKWNYKWEADTSTPHIGPMAQDFKSAFYPGRDDKSISTLEFDGVELAAIQGLNQKVESETRKAESEIEMLKTENANLKARLKKLEQLVIPKDADMK